MLDVNEINEFFNREDYSINLGYATEILDLIHFELDLVPINYIRINNIYLEVVELVGLYVGKLYSSLDACDDFNGGVYLQTDPNIIEDIGFFNALYQSLDFFDCSFKENELFSVLSLLYVVRSEKQQDLMKRFDCLINAMKSIMYAREASLRIKIKESSQKKLNGMRLAKENRREDALNFIRSELKIFFSDYKNDCAFIDSAQKAADKLMPVMRSKGYSYGSRWLITEINKINKEQRYWIPRNEKI